MASAVFLLYLATLVPNLAGASFSFQTGDRVTFIGNTFAERMRFDGWFETMLLARFPNHDLVFRNLGWSGDTVKLRPRPKDFGDLFTHLQRQRADVIVACFGMNESFDYDGETGLEAFANDLRTFLRRLRQLNGESAPRIILVSPTPMENHGAPLPEAGPRNRILASYVATMQIVARELELPFIDLFNPWRKQFDHPRQPLLTINGMHLTEQGYYQAARLMLEALGEQAPNDSAKLNDLRQSVVRKNRAFFDLWRAVNGEYIYGRRNPRDSSFPGGIPLTGELATLEEKILAMDAAVHQHCRRLNLDGREP